MTTLSKSTIYRRVKDNLLAPPLNLGGNVCAWRVCDVEDFIEGKNAIRPVGRRNLGTRNPVFKGGRKS